jgi:hypothetical protein
MVRAKFVQLVIVCAAFQLICSTVRADHQITAATTQHAISLASATSLATPTSQPSDRYARAKIAYADAVKSCLDKFHETSEYKTALANLESAKSTRLAAMGDEIAATAETLMQARSAVTSLEREALSRDAAVAAAKHDLDAITTVRGGTQRAELPPLNRSILTYAEKCLGKKIGNGECWTLAHEAFLRARARMVDTYVWGRELKPNEMILPGDIMQFTSARFEGPNWWLVMGEPNHTAVVQKVESKTSYWILEQNPTPVVSKRIDFQYFKSGSYKVYRPLPQ